MKAVNKSSKKVLDKLTKGLTKGKSRKIDNTDGTFMPVVVEQIGEIKEGPLFSVAHYFEQNGDLVPDPEMVFLKAMDDSWYPIYFNTNGRDRYSVVLENKKIKSFYPKQQKDDASFANTWMRNIKGQQGI